MPRYTVSLTPKTVSTRIVSRDVYDAAVRKNLRLQQRLQAAKELLRVANQSNFISKSWHEKAEYFLMEED